MPRNLILLKKIPIVVDIKKISLTSEICERLGDRAHDAKINTRHINVYSISYRSQGHTVKGFIAEPKNGDHLPCVVYNRGGSNEFGTVRIGYIYHDLAKIVRKGYIVIGSQYSGNAGSEGKDEQGGGDIEDVLNLYKILKAYPRADSSRIGMYGASRGGMMTYLALTRVKWIKAAISIAGSADLVRSMRLRPEMKDVYTEAFGATLKGLKERSAVYWPEKFPNKTPLLLIHGTGDWRVSALDSLDLSKKLYEHKKPHRLVLFEGADHSISEFQEDRWRLILEWLDRYVKKQETFPSLKPHGK